MEVSVLQRELEFEWLVQMQKGMNGMSECATYVYEDFFVCIYYVLHTHYY